LTSLSALGAVVNAIRAPYEELLAPGTGERPLGKRHVDDAQVTDHHAIIPTDRRAGTLDADERKIYDLVCRRLLQAWHGDFVWAATTVITEVGADQFHSAGTAIEAPGWKVLELGGAKKVPKKKAEDEEPDESEQALPAGLAKGQAQRVVDAKTLEKKTRPPPRLSDATLLTAMETAGRTLDEQELSRAMRDSGLGTPATRATSSPRRHLLALDAARARSFRRAARPRKRGGPSSAWEPAPPVHTRRGSSVLGSDARAFRLARGRTVVDASTTTKSGASRVASASPSRKPATSCLVTVQRRHGTRYWSRAGGARRIGLSGARRGLL
jgi:hypothetical protein